MRYWNTLEDLKIYLETYWDLVPESQLQRVGSAYPASSVGKVVRLSHPDMRPWDLLVYMRNCSWWWRVTHNPKAIWHSFKEAWPSWEPEFARQFKDELEGIQAVMDSFTPEEGAKWRQKSSVIS